MDDTAHLRTIHDLWNTPEAVVLNAVRAVTRAPVVSRTRIVHGAANEVYAFAFDGAPSLIVRIARDATKNIEPERWAIAQCEARGVAAPHIHDITHITVDGQPLHICVMAKIEGERLCDVKLTPTETRRVLNQLGEWLSQLHAIPVSGFSYLDGEGRAPGPDYEGAVAWLQEIRPEFETVCRAVGIEDRTASGWLEFMESVMAVVRPTSVLAHNDLISRHVLVKDGHLAGVIDFGEVAGEPALNEFAKWDFFEGARFPVGWIRETYANHSLFAPGHEPFYRTLWLLNGLNILRWYHKSGYAEGVQEAKTKLLEERHV